MIYWAVPQRLWPLTISTILHKFKWSRARRGHHTSWRPSSESIGFSVQSGVMDNLSWFPNSQTIWADQQKAQHEAPSKCVCISPPPAFLSAYTRNMLLMTWWPAGTTSRIEEQNCMIKSCGDSECTLEFNNETNKVLFSYVCQSRQEYIGPCWRQVGWKNSHLGRVSSKMLYRWCL